MALIQPFREAGAKSFRKYIGISHHDFNLYYSNFCILAKWVYGLTSIKTRREALLVIGPSQLKVQNNFSDPLKHFMLERWDSMDYLISEKIKFKQDFDLSQSIFYKVRLTKLRFLII